MKDSVESDGGTSYKFHIIGGGEGELSVEGGGGVFGGFYPARTPYYKVQNVCKKIGEDCSIVLFETKTKEAIGSPDDGKDKKGRGTTNKRKNSQTKDDIIQ